MVVMETPDTNEVENDTNLPCMRLFQCFHDRHDGEIHWQNLPHHWLFVWLRGLMVFSCFSDFNVFICYELKESTRYTVDSQQNSMHLDLTYLI